MMIIQQNLLSIEPRQLLLQSPGHTFTFFLVQDHGRVQVLCLFYLIFCICVLVTQEVTFGDTFRQGVKTRLRAVGLRALETCKSEFKIRCFASSTLMLSALISTTCEGWTLLTFLFCFFITNCALMQLNET